MTAQIPEIIYIDGKRRSLLSCPSIPKGHPSIRRLTADELEERGVLLSTALWREYIGTWKIKDEHLLLVSLKGRFVLIRKGPILADWFSGVITVARGKCLQYIHAGFGSIYEQYEYIAIENGIVVDSFVVDNAERPVLR